MPAFRRRIRRYGLQAHGQGKKALGHPGAFVLRSTGLTATALSLTLDTMNTIIAAPVDWIGSIARLRLPSKADHRLQDLIDRNTDAKRA